MTSDIDNDYDEDNVSEAVVFVVCHHLSVFVLRLPCRFFFAFVLGWED